MLVDKNYELESIAKPLKEVLLISLHEREEKLNNELKAVKAHIKWINNDDRFLSKEIYDDNYRNSFVPEGTYLEIEENSREAIDISLKLYGKNISKIDDTSWAAHIYSHMMSSNCGYSVSDNEHMSNPMSEVKYDTTVYRKYYEEHYKNK